MSLANGLSILFIISKNQLLVLLIFAIVFFVSISFYLCSDIYYSPPSVNFGIGLFFFYIYIYLFYLFIFGCVGSSLLRALSLVAASGGYSSSRCAASHCGGLSCCGAWALGAQASVVVARGLSSCGFWALERRLSSCGSRA